MQTLKLTSDVVFKSFMMSKNTNNYKARLIHLITGIPESDLKKAIYQSVELPIDKNNQKVMKTDIITTIKNHILSIEMNKDYYETILKKNSNYISKVKAESLKSGEDYKEQKQIIQINFDNYHIYKGEKIIYEFKMLEIDTLEEEYEGESISYHIDLENLKSYNKEDELKRLLELFISENVENLRGIDIMDEAINELEILSHNENIIGLYDAELLEQAIREEIKDKALKNGLEKGIKKGISQRNTEIAKNLLKENIDISIISKTTGLSISEIEKLK